MTFRLPLIFLLSFLIANCSSKPKDETLSETKPYIAVEAWPGWLCADFKDGRDQSLWYRESIGKSDIKTYDHTCDYWSQHPPGTE